MSWFNNLSSSINSAINDFTESAIKSYNSMTAYPQEIKCPRTTCHHVNPVPASLFQWSCSCGHLNPAHIGGCPSGTCVRPQLPPPEITCAACHGPIQVPTTNLVKDFKTMINDAPENLQRGVQSVRTEFNALGNIPETFPCSHCSCVLSTPRGPWVCQVNECDQQNSEHDLTCVRCGVQRYSLGVLCGICGRSTSIPKNKLQADSSIMTARTTASLAKSAAYATNKPYIECIHCNGIVHPPAAQLATVLRIPSPTTQTNPDGTVVASSELQLEFYEPTEAPGAPADVTCGNCLRVMTYSANDVHCHAIDAKRRPLELAEQRARDAEASGARPGVRPGDSETVCLACHQQFTTLTRRRIVCARCQHAFCSDHAPYVRKVNQFSGVAGEDSFCLKCATDFDNERAQQGNLGTVPAATVTPMTTEAPVSAPAPVSASLSTSSPAPAAEINAPVQSENTTTEGETVNVSDNTESA